MDFEHVYAFGYLFAKADMEYFRFIRNPIRYGCDREILFILGQFDKDNLLGIALGGDLC